MSVVLNPVKVALAKASRVYPWSKFKTVHAFEHDLDVEYEIDEQDEHDPVSIAERLTVHAIRWRGVDIWHELSQLSRTKVRLILADVIEVEGEGK